MPLPSFSRRATLALAALLLGGCASRPPADTLPPPIVFVHGNGDNAAVWQTTLWRFESNGWPRERLHTIDLPYPLARDLDDRPQPGRSSADEAMRRLATEVDAVLKATGAAKAVLVGNSRGGILIRHYVANGGGAAKVSHAVLGGTPNHGVWADPGFLPTSEFNGAGPLLTALNRPGATGLEITPGVRWLTIRSDGNDKYAQPDGRWVGAPALATRVGFDGPALKGATNVVIPGIDHRETAFGAAAFAETFRFVAGRAPTTLQALAQPRVVLGGIVSGLGLDNRPGSGDFVNNLPLAGATVEVYATDAATGERLGAALHRQTVGADGRWGPLVTTSKTALEFVVGASGYATTHVYRRPFPRSSDIVQLRGERIAAGDRDAAAVVTLSRPRGYFGIPRDEIVLGGQSPPPGIPAGVAGVSTAKVRYADAAPRTVVGRCNAEEVVGRSWPTAGNHVVILELTD